ncbi:hypothetical protein N2152v2_004706 [Parachlorella kessleri]
MGESVLLEALRQPATAVLVVACCCVWYLLYKHGLGYPDVGMSYESVVEHQELWRMASAQLSHVDVLHLVFNVSALWSIGVVEKMGAGRGLGTLYYLQYTALLFLLSPVMLPLFGLADIPMYLAPFASLIITSIIIPKASFLGHLAGILAGYLISLGIFDVLGPWGSLAILAAALAGVGWLAFKQGRLQWPRYLPLPSGPADDVEQGSGSGSGPARIVNGMIQRR